MHKLLFFTAIAAYSLSSYCSESENQFWVSLGKDKLTLAQFFDTFRSAKVLEVTNTPILAKNYPRAYLKLLRRTTHSNSVPLTKSFQIDKLTDSLPLHLDPRETFAQLLLEFIVWDKIRDQVLTHTKNQVYDELKNQISDTNHLDDEVWEILYEHPERLSDQDFVDGAHLQVMDELIDTTEDLV